MTGTPGIRKSCFLLYLLLVLSKHHSVALEAQSLFYCFNKGNRSCKVKSPSELRLDCNKFIFLSDVDKAKPAYEMYKTFAYRCRLVYVASPDPNKKNWLTNL